MIQIGRFILYAAFIAALFTSVNSKGLEQENQETEQYNKALLNAVKNGDTEAVLSLLKQGANPNAYNERHETGLFLAADGKEENTLLVKILLDFGADFHIRNEYDNSVVVTAASHGFTDILKLLLDRGADANETGNGYSALKAAAVESVEEVRLLLARGAKVDARDKDGMTPLLYAMSLSLPQDVAQELLKAGANVNAYDQEGSTPLMQAARMDRAEVIPLLLQYGAAINAQDKNGWTPLMYAVCNANEESIKLLLQRGANYRIKDHDHKDAMRIAQEHYDAPTVALLCKAGIKPHHVPPEPTLAQRLTHKGPDRTDWLAFIDSRVPLIPLQYRFQLLTPELILYKNGHLIWQKDFPDAHDAATDPATWREHRYLHRIGIA